MPYAPGAKITTSTSLTLYAIWANSTTPTYGISLNETGTYTFPTETEGYDPVDSKEITITNRASDVTGNLSITLSGDNPDAFILDTTTLSSIPIQGSKIFNIRPKDGLKQGTYNTTVTVQSSRGLTATFYVRFTVNPVPIPTPTPPAPPTTLPTAPSPPTDTSDDDDDDYANYTDYRIEQDLGMGDFILYEDYTNPLAVTTTLSNTGNLPTGLLTLGFTGDNSLEVSPSTLESIPPGETATFTVRIKNDLPIGTYRTTLTIQNDIDTIRQSYTILGTVNPKSDGLIAGFIGGASNHGFGLEFQDYTPITAEPIAINNLRYQPTGELTISLTGENPDAFVLSTTTLDSIPASEAVENAVSVKPKEGLPPGDYFASVVIQGEDGLHASVAVFFRVG